MDTHTKYMMTVNAGSSSIKLALFNTSSPEKALEVTVADIGEASAHLITTDGSQLVDAADHTAAAKLAMQRLMTRIPIGTIVAIGHRIVHGGPHYYKPHDITDALLTELQKLMAFNPRHLSAELRLIELFRDMLPNARQVACFDTAFHHDLPTQARLLPSPRKFEKLGVRRYGFHGLSYASVLEELRRIEGEAAANGKVIIAHLGSGASLAALCGGKSIDTTMSMTPASGIPMSTRSGDLDPGLALYLVNIHGYNLEQFNHMASFESGLLGISETTPDMKKLLAIESADTRAKDAIDIFCYNVKKSIGGLAAALGGLNTLVFTGGMGENAPKIRARICDGLDFLGISLDPTRNAASKRLISAPHSPTGVHVIHADEATTIARETAKYITKE